MTIKAHKKTVERRTRAGVVREEVEVPERTVTRSRTVGVGVGPATKAHIDSVIQELQFRTLLPRR